jgi:hypothetical protein
MSLIKKEKKRKEYNSNMKANSSSWIVFSHVTLNQPSNDISSASHKDTMLHHEDKIIIDKTGPYVLDQ